MQNVKCKMQKVKFYFRWMNFGKFFFIIRYSSSILCKGSERGPAKPMRPAPIMPSQKKKLDVSPLRLYPTKPAISKDNPPKNATNTNPLYITNFVVHFIFHYTPALLFSFLSIKSY